MTDEHKQKISKALMNNTNGKGNKGHHPSLETRKGKHLGIKMDSLNING